MLTVFKERVAPDQTRDVVGAFEEGVVAHTGEDVPSADLAALVESVPALRPPVAALDGGRRVAGRRRRGGVLRARGPAPLEAPQQGHLGRQRHVPQPQLSPSASRPDRPSDAGSESAWSGLGQGGAGSSPAAARRWRCRAAASAASAATSTVVQRRSRTTTRPDATTWRMSALPLAQTSCRTGSGERGVHVGPVASTTTTSARLPGSSEPRSCVAADRLGAADRRQLDGGVGAERRRAAVEGEAGGEGRGAQHVDGVARVLAVAPEGDAAAAGDELRVPPGAGDALAEPQVAHGHAATATSRARTTSTSASSRCTAWASSTCGPSAPSASRWSTGSPCRCGRGTTGRRRPTATGGTSGSSPARRASALAATTSSSDIRSWPTSVTQPSTRSWPAVSVSTSRWRASTASTEPAYGPSAHVPAPGAERAADADGVVRREHPVGVGDRARPRR